MSTTSWLAELDPAISQAIATISGAIAMFIISVASYYFPKGKDRFDEDDDDQEGDARRTVRKRRR